MADYAISNVPRRVVYAASGVGPYAFTFEILVNTDVAVYKDDVLLTLTTDYTVTIAANGTGSITLVATPTGATQIAIVGSRAIQRTSDFVTGGDFFANTVNDELDSLTIFAQQNAEAVNRALQAPQTDPTNIDMTLPRASVRANKTLAFDANGDPTTGEVVGDNRGNWAAGIAYNKRDIAKDTTNGNVYYVNTAHTSSGSLPITSNADVAKWDLLVDNASAGTSATAAAASASAAAGSASAASTSATNAASSASAASTSASNASTSATNAANSATAASGSASTASTQATNAGNSATAAATSATNASNSATAAASSATSASNSATAAAASESNASTSATNAATSASTATTQASNASTSATAAAGSASAAATSATNASNSASAAATSETNAATSAAAAAAALDNFDDRYLGVKTAAPTVDNDGNALVAGALYFNSGAVTAEDKGMWVYDGGTWIAASAASQAIMVEYEYTATAGQTTFTGADDNALTLSYTAGSIIVTLNGVVLDASDYTASNGNSVVLAVGAAAGDELNVRAFSTFDIANTYTQAQVDAFAVKLTGNQTVAGVKTFSSDPVMGVSGLSGTLAKARLPAGSVLQVVQVAKSDTFSTTVQDATFVDITGLSASITPTSATSTILVLASIGKCSCTTSNRSVNFRLDRSGTLIALGDTAGDRVRISFASQAGGYDAAGRGGQSASLNFVDSPASASALTYKIQMSGHNGEATVINRGGEDIATADGPHARSISTLILMEIAG